MTIDLQRVACFLFSTYLATINGHDKFDPLAKKLIKDTDLLQAQMSTDVSQSVQDLFIVGPPWRLIQ